MPCPAGKKSIEFGDEHCHRPVLPNCTPYSGVSLAAGVLVRMQIRGYALRRSYGVNDGGLGRSAERGSIPGWSLMRLKDCIKEINWV